MSTDSPGRDQRQLATGAQEVNAVIPKTRPNISRQMGHGMWMGTGERCQHLLELFRSRNGLHDAEGIDGKGRQTHLKTRIPGTSQLDLLQTLPLLTHQRGTEQDLVLPRLESILESLIIVRAETAGPDMDDVEDNAPGSLAEHLLRQCSLLCTGPGPGTKVGQLRIKRRLINPEQHNIVWCGKRAAPLKKQLPSHRIGTVQGRRHQPGEQQGETPKNGEQHTATQPTQGDGAESPSSRSITGNVSNGWENPLIRGLFSRRCSASFRGMN